MAEHHCNTCDAGKQLLRLGRMLDTGSTGCNYTTIIKLANMRAWVYVDVFLIGGLLLGWQTFSDSLTIPWKKIVTSFFYIPCMLRFDIKFTAETVYS